MFCPKCGNDCGEFQFCPQCGTQMPKVEEKTAGWAVGMACPHCGGTQLEGNCCAFCGAVLKEDVPAETGEEDSYEFPYGKYQDGSDWIQLTKDAVVIHNSVYCKSGDPMVPYNQLVEVEYTRSEKKVMKIFPPVSRLSFCWNSTGKSDPFATENSGISSLAVSFVTRDDDAQFFHAFALLRLLAPPTVKFSLKVIGNDDVSADMSDRNIDWDGYFERFNPYRDRAVEALGREYAIPEKKAKVMVDTAFEPRQLALYEKEPALAIRDMNRILSKRQRESEERIRELDEHLTRMKRRR